MENDKEVQEEQVNSAAEEVSDSVLTNINGDHHHDETSTDDSREDHPEVDFSQFTKEDFVAYVKDLSKEDDFRKVDTLLETIKPLFDEIRQAEKDAALVKFKSDGGLEDDFEYRFDEFDHAFDATVKLIRDRKNQHFKSLEEKKI
ncbi:MAG: hypothetical protein U5K54_09555 [Cytophagales bacterium]|nr:hypothetical protein [Cytophagales bacterium]